MANGQSQTDGGFSYVISYAAKENLSLSVVPV
jgi:hypothetical protein